MKIFIDRWSQYIRDERIDFKGDMSKKKAYVIVTGHNPDPKTAALPLISQFNYIFNYVGVEFVDYMIGEGNKPGEIANDTFAKAKACLWSERISQAKVKS